MKELYEYIKVLDATASPRTLDLVQKKIQSVCEKKYDGVGYFILILKQGLKIVPFLVSNDKYDLQDSFEEPYDGSNSALYRFLKTHSIHSILIKKDVDIQAFAKFLGNQGQRPPQVAVNVYQKDYNQAQAIFEDFLRIMSYSNQDFQTMIQVIADYQETTDQNRKVGLQKLRGDWINLYHRLHSNIEELLSFYGRVTFVIQYPLAQSRREEINPEGFHIFFEKAEFDLSYTKVRTSTFLEKSIYISKGDRRERLDSLSLKKGIQPEDLFSLIYRIRGKNRLLFTASLDWQPQLIQGILPDAVANKFSEKYPLPESPKVTTLSDGQWGIIDTSKTVWYVIEKSDNRLLIYQKINDIPNLTINPVKLGVLDVEDEFSEFLKLRQKNTELTNLFLQVKQASKKFIDNIRQQKEEIEALKLALEKEREKQSSNTYLTSLEQQLQDQQAIHAQMQAEIEELKLRIQDIEQERQQALQRLDQMAQIQSSQKLSSEMIEELAQKLKLPGEYILRLLSPELLENVLRDQIAQEVSSEGASSPYTLKLALKSKQVGRVIEKGLRDGHFSTNRVQEFLNQAIDPWDKKEVARQLAGQLAGLSFPKIPNYRLESFFDFSTSPGGDACFVYPLDAERKHVLICMMDLQGTGLEQSCELFWFKLILERIVQDLTDRHPEKILERLHQEMLHVREGNAQFHCGAGLVGILNNEDHQFTYLRAGLPYLYLYNRNTGEGRFIKEYGVPRLGLQIITGAYQREPAQITFSTGDLLILQTNGLLDCLGSYDAFDAMMKFLPSGTLSDFFREKIWEKNTGRPLNDDVYVLGMEYLQEANT